MAVTSYPNNSDPKHPMGRNLLSPRYELKWVAGARGKPSINADIQDASEATRMIADPDFEVLGTNAVSADTAYGAEGGITFATHGGANDSTIILPHLDANQSAWTQVTWGTDRQVDWHCFLKLGSSIATQVVWAGLKLTNTSVVATDDNQAFFRYAAATDAYWHVVYSIGGTDYDVTTTVAVTASTEYTFEVRFDTARFAYFYINGKQVAVSSAAMTDATDLIPYVGVLAVSSAVVKTHTLYGQAISRDVA